MDRELGPFGRAFVGKSPSKGAIIMMFPFWIFFLIGLVRLFDPEYSFFVICGLEIFLLIIILSIFLFTTLVIEPHFNKGTRNGKVKLTIADNEEGFISDSSIYPEVESFKTGMERVSEIWDFTGGGLKSLFEVQDIRDLNFSRSESGRVAWTKVLLMWFSINAWLYISTFATVGIIMVSGVDGRMFDIALQISVIVTFLGVGLFFIIPIVMEKKTAYARSLFRNPGVFFVLALVAIVTVVDLFATVIVGTIWDVLIGIPDQEAPYFDDPSSASDPVILILIFIGMTICPAIFEELIFRGYILDTFRSWYSDTYSIFASGLLFGMMHYSIFFPLDFYPIVATSIGGFLYAWVRIRTESLWPPILCHAFWNGSIFVSEYI